MDLYISDLDGTLLNENAKLSNYTIKTINKLIDNGLNFTIATARAYESAGKIIKPLNIKLPIILNNGSFVYDLKNKKNILENYLPNTICKDILNLLDNYEISPFLSCKKCLKKSIEYIDLSLVQEAFVKEHLDKGDERFRKVNKYNLKNKKIINLFTLGKKEKLEIVNEKLKKFSNSISTNLYYDFYYKTYWLEVRPKNATKGNSCIFLKNKYDFEKFHVFGDNLNDISMFKKADKSYAVKNANKTLKKHADYIIKENTKDSVARFLNKNDNILRTIEKT